MQKVEAVENLKEIKRVHCKLLISFLSYLTVFGIMSYDISHTKDSAVDLTDKSVVKPRDHLYVDYVWLEDVCVKLTFAMCTLQRDDSNEFPEITLGG